MKKITTVAGQVLSTRTFLRPVSHGSIRCIVQASIRGCSWLFVVSNDGVKFSHLGETESWSDEWFSCTVGDGFETFDGYRFFWWILGWFDVFCWFRVWKFHNWSFEVSKKVIEQVFAGGATSWQGHYSMCLLPQMTHVHYTNWNDWMHHCNWIDVYDFLCMDSLLLCSYKSVKQLNHISMLWLVQLRFDTEEDMSFCRCMKCGEEGQDVFWRERVSNHWSVTLQESSNWKWNGPYFDDQSFVETSYPSSMYRPCTAQSSRTKTLDGCLSFISVSVRIHVQSNQKIFPSLWKEPMTRFAITKLKCFLKCSFWKDINQKIKHSRQCTVERYVPSLLSWYLHIFTTRRCWCWDVQKSPTELEEV